MYNILSQQSGHHGMRNENLFRIIDTFLPHYPLGSWQVHIDKCQNEDNMVSSCRINDHNVQYTLAFLSISYQHNCLFLVFHILNVLKIKREYRYSICLNGVFYNLWVVSYKNMFPFWLSYIRTVVPFPVLELNTYMELTRSSGCNVLVFCVDIFYCM